MITLIAHCFLITTQRNTAKRDDVLFANETADIGTLPIQQPGVMNIKNVSLTSKDSFCPSTSTKLASYASC